MSTQVTLTIRDDVYRRAEWLARQIGRPVADILAERIESGLDESEIQPLSAIETLSDDEVLALANLRMEKSQSKRLTVLLDKQQAGKMNNAERYELSALMREYDIGLLHKAQGLAEAVRRGLREPLSP